MEVLKNVFTGGGGDKKAKNKKRKSGSALTNRSSISGVDVPRVRSSSSSSCIQSEREGFVFVERLKEGSSTSDVASSATTTAAANPISSSATTSPPPATTSTSASSEVDATLAARLSDFDLRLVQVDTEGIQRTPPSHAAAATAAATAASDCGGGDADNFLTLKNVRGGFCLDKKLEKKVRSRSSNNQSSYDEEPWLRPPLNLDEFDYDFTLERSVLRDFN